MSKLHQHRLTSLRKFIPKKAAFLISNSSDVAYFIGLNTLVPSERECFLLVTAQKAYCILSHFTVIPSENTNLVEQLFGIYPDQLAKYLIDIAKQEKLEAIFGDEKTLFVSELKALENLIVKENSEIALQSLDTKQIARLRVIKDVTELEAIHFAAQISQEVFASIKPRITTGVTELEVRSWILSEFIQRQASEAFPTIIAFGGHTAVPHHQPTDKKLAVEMPVLIDMGAKYNMYCSDMTRSWWHGTNPSELYIQIEHHVHTAYNSVLSLLADANCKIVVATETRTETTDNFTLQTQLTQKSSITTSLEYKDLDGAARNYFKQVGYASEFCHTTGHGIGLDIHEYPSLSWLVEDCLYHPAAITVEPGLYFPNQFGIRHENTILVL